jgi:mono/diheme cytochrome c family protein
MRIVPGGSIPGESQQTHLSAKKTSGGAMTASRKFRTVSVACIGTMMIVASAAALAADNLDVGKDQYDAACAVCHGLKGTGDGPMRTQLTSRVPDLTVLAKDNRGVFPFDRVYQIIDGRREIAAHGPREMPVWGRAFRMQSSLFFENYPLHDAESGARSRILALTEYIYRLQAK